MRHLPGSHSPLPDPSPPRPRNPLPRARPLRLASAGVAAGVLSPQGPPPSRSARCVQTTCKFRAREEFGQPGSDRRTVLLLTLRVELVVADETEQPPPRRESLGLADQPVGADAEISAFRRIEGLLGESRLLEPAADVGREVRRT